MADAKDDELNGPNGRAILPKRVWSAIKVVLSISTALLWFSLLLVDLPHSRAVRGVALLGLGIGWIVWCVDQFWGLLNRLRDRRFSRRKSREEAGMKPDGLGLWSDDRLVNRLMSTTIMVVVAISLMYVGYLDLSMW